MTTVGNYKPSYITDLELNNTSTSLKLRIHVIKEFDKFVISVLLIKLKHEANKGKISSRQRLKYLFDFQRTS